MDFIVCEYYQPDLAVWSAATVVSLIGESNYLVEFNGSKKEVQQKHIRFIVAAKNQNISVGTEVEYKTREGWSNGKITSIKGSFASIELPDFNIVMLRRSDLRIVAPIKISYLEFEVKLARSNIARNTRIEKLLKEVIRNCIFAFTDYKLRIFNVAFFENDYSHEKQSDFACHSNLINKSLVLLKESVELIIQEEVSCSKSTLC